MHETVQSARHRRQPRRGHGNPNTRVRDTPRSAVLSGTGNIRPGQIRQRRCKTRRHLSTVRRRSAHMYRYVLHVGIPVATYYIICGILLYTKT